MIALAKVSGESKLFAFLAYLLGILGFVIVFLVRRKDKFAMYHAKQSLVLFVAWIIVRLMFIVPVAGWIAGIVCSVILFIAWVGGIINALSGKEKPVLLIGHYGQKIKL